MKIFWIVLTEIRVLLNRQIQPQTLVEIGVRDNVLSYSGRGGY
jgi:hypothetical protein